MSDPSVYWIWFMTQNAEKLAEHYNAKAPTIPKYWKTITAENAQESLTDGPSLMQRIMFILSSDVLVANQRKVSSSTSRKQTSSTKSTVHTTRKKGPVHYSAHC